MVKRRPFVQLGNRLVRQEDIESVDLLDLTNGRIFVLMKGQCMAIEVVGVQALDAIMQLHPSAVEGIRFKYGWNAWVVHNLVAHPIMQIMALIGLPKLGLAIHDITVPRPR